MAGRMAEPRRWCREGCASCRVHRPRPPRGIVVEPFEDECCFTKEDDVGSDETALRGGGLGGWGRLSAWSPIRQ